MDIEIPKTDPADFPNLVIDPSITLLNNGLNSASILLESKKTLKV